MDTIQIDTGVKRIAVNGDPERIIEFSPQDVAWAERFYGLIREFEEKQAEYQARAEVLDSDQLDERGLPVDMPKGLALLREMCEFLRGQIDNVFGPGTSKKAFGDAMTLTMFEQFFTGIMPYVQSARAEKVDKYRRPATKKGGRKVMK
jgi:hypothetical protein